MLKKTQFDNENVLISVLGHLVLVAIMVSSFSFVVDKAKLVSNNRIQIVEIDLKSVKISGDETKLYNTTKPQSETHEEKNDKTAQEQKVKIKNTTLVDEDKKNSKTKQTNTSKKENDGLAKHKTVVKVNREVLSLDRTMTVSVVDALRVALTRCWNIDTNRSDISDIRAVAHLVMLPTGVVNKIWFESESRALTDPSFAYVLDTIKEAIKTCQPFSMLPRKEFNKWEKIQLTFYPNSGKIM